MHSYDIRPLSDYLSGSAPLPSEMSSITENERAFPLHPAQPLREGAFDQGAALAGTGAAPTFGGEK